MTGAASARQAAGLVFVDPRPPVDPERPRRPGWAFALGLPGSAVGVTLAARAAPGTVEALYSRALYPALAEGLVLPARLWARLVGHDPALGTRAPALGEVLLVGFTLWIVWRLWRSLRRGALALVRTLALTSGTLAWLFLLAWGFNYARAPLAESLGLEAGPPATAGELEGIARSLGADLVRDLEAGLAPETAPAEDARRAWERAAEARPALGTLPTAVLTAPLLSPAFTASGISGIFNPFTHEANVCAGLVPVDRPFVACHELAHRVGWAREDEANFLAWFVGAGHGSPWVRRGANALALLHVMRALRRADPGTYRAVLKELPEAALDLFREREAFWRAEKIETATRVASRVNDTYLRVQGQEGVVSYGRMVELVVAEMRRRDQSKDAPLDSR